MAEILAGGDLTRMLTLVAERARTLAAARTAFIALPTEPPNTLTADVAVGEDADQVSGLTFRVSHTIVGRVYSSRRAITSRVSPGATKTGLPIGPVILLPLDTGETTRGVLAVIGAPHDLAFGDPLRRHLLLFACSSAALIEMAEEHRQYHPSDMAPSISTVPSKGHLRLTGLPGES
jgi:hypothetical protein